MPVAPAAELSKFHNLWMVVLLIVLDRQTSGVINPHIATESPKNARDFKRQKFRVGPKEECRRLGTHKFRCRACRYRSHLERRLPYRTNTLILSPVRFKSLCAISVTVASSNLPTQSCSLILPGSRNGRYLERIAGSSRDGGMESD